MTNNSINSTTTNVTPFVFRGTLFSNLLKCIESENRHDTMASTNNSSAFDSNSQITDSRSFPIGFLKQNTEASTTFMFNNTNNNTNYNNTSRNNSSSQNSNQSSSEMKNSSNEKFKIEPIMSNILIGVELNFFPISFSIILSFLSILHCLVENSNNEDEFAVNSNKTTRKPPIILINETSASKVNRKKTMPNIERQNSIVNQLFKKKFSFGQIKVRFLSV